MRGLTIGSLLRTINIDRSMYKFNRIEGLFGQLPISKSVCPRRLMQRTIMCVGNGQSWHPVKLGLCKNIRVDNDEGRRGQNT